MRGRITLCVGLGLVLGVVSMASAGDLAPPCCPCRCLEAGILFCTQGFDAQACAEACNELGDDQAPLSCFEETECSAVPGCPQSEKRAPIASPYGIAALLVALGGFGAWRLRKRAT